MRILHLLSQRPEQTGSGVYSLHMMRQAAASGARNALLAGVPDKEPLPVLPDCDQVHLVRFGADLPHAVVGMSDVMPYASVRFRDLSPAQLDAYEAAFAHSLRAAVAGFAPDIIHANHLWLVTSLARRLFPHIPMVASCHGSDLRQFRTNPHLRERVLEGCARLDGVCALHAAQKDEICELYGMDAGRVHVTGAGYDGSVFSCVLKPQTPPVRICYAGKLSAAKGVPWLLRAVDEMPEDVELHICGSGTGAEADAIAAEMRRIGARVVLHGTVGQERLSEVMQQAHIFVLPSFYEGLPLVLLEALACGCRLVATRLPGTQEALGGLGEDMLRLVDLPRLRTVDTPLEGDEPAFVEGLRDALSGMAALCRMQTHPPVSPAAERVLDEFSWNAVFTRVRKVYLRSSPRRAFSFF